jgi:hypothetical protein
MYNIINNATKQYPIYHDNSSAVSIFQFDYHAQKVWTCTIGIKNICTGCVNETLLARKNPIF